MSKGWIGVDFDKTLSQYNGGELNKHGSGYCGPPIPAMVARVRAWLAEGQDVRIFTARVWYPRPEDVGNVEYRTRKQQADSARIAIDNWCIEHLGQHLPITCEKDYNMVELWDDRAIQVHPNTGIPAVNAVAYKLHELNALLDSLLDPAEHTRIIEAIKEWREKHG